LSLLPELRSASGQAGPNSNLEAALPQIEDNRMHPFNRIR
jgi:hypothetical protein